MTNPFKGKVKIVEVLSGKKAVATVSTPKLTVGRKVEEKRWMVVVSLWTMKPRITWTWKEGDYLKKWQVFPTRQEAQAACTKLREALRGARVIR